MFTVRFLFLAWVGMAGCTSDFDGGGGRRGPKGKKERCPGVPEAEEFRVTVFEALIFPYKPGTDLPWDWDGDVPDWLITALRQLGTALAQPTLLTAGELLNLVDEYAPELVEGSVPPDPQLSVFIESDYGYGYSSSSWWSSTSTVYYGYTAAFADADADNVYDPRFNLPLEVLLYDEEYLWLDFEDEDVAFADYVGSLYFDRAGLAALANCGKTTERQPDSQGLYSVTLEVEAL